MTKQRMSRKDRQTAKQMHADLAQLGYDGSYERVAAFVQAWKGNRRRAQQTTDHGILVLLVFRPGETFQFDWSGNRAMPAAIPSSYRGCVAKFGVARHPPKYPHCQFVGERRLARSSSRACTIRNPSSCTLCFSMSVIRSRTTISKEF